MSTGMKSGAGSVTAGLRGLLGLGLVGLGLAGCVMTGSAPRSMPALNGALTLSAPSGFCLDTEGSRADSSQAFAIFGTCAAISGVAAGPAARQPAVLTATVRADASLSQPLDKSTAMLEKFFRSAPGRAALARDGKSASVKVLSVRAAPGLFAMKLRDTSASTGTPVAQDYWRGVIDVRGYLVSISVLPVLSAPVGDADQRALLVEFAQQIAQQNKAGSAPTAAASK
ncbi:hypothetical protein [Phaeovulum sp. W22_SRMD_FR3]|uniref:hypothetical protein n=1 Tax=Phaeovulum sp. W22_SRMD_FR3 TaxID=3240274 RepID=UPI003F968D8D